MTLDEAKKLTQNSVLLVESKRWRVNGKIKLWKRDSTRIKIPLKHGLYAHDYLTEENVHLFRLEQ